jgi:hypothetical protein
MACGRRVGVRMPFLPWKPGYGASAWERPSYLCQRCLGASPDFPAGGEACRNSGDKGASSVYSGYLSLPPSRTPPFRTTQSAACKGCMTSLSWLATGPPPRAKLPNCPGAAAVSLLGLICLGWASAGPWWPGRLRGSPGVSSKVHMCFLPCRLPPAACVLLALLAAVRGNSSGRVLPGLVD